MIFFGKKLKVNIEKLAFFILLIGLSLLYFSRYFNRTLPYTEGWGLFYSNMLEEGKVPYRDFYYYLPPLNLLIDFVLWKMSFGYMLIYRMWRIVERICIVALMYHLLCKVTKPRFAWFAAFLGSVLSASTVFDLLGDYNQTCDLMALLLCWAVLKYAKYFRENNAKKEYLFLGLSGCVIGLSFLLKQTIFVAEVILFFVILTILFIVKKKKNYICSVLATGAGAIAPVLVVFVYLLNNGAFVPYVEQVYLNVSSKGSIAYMLLSPLRQFKLDYVYIVCVVIGALYGLYKLNSMDMSIVKKNFLTVAIYAYLFGSVAVIFNDRLFIAIGVIFAFSYWVVWSMLPIGAAFLVPKTSNSVKENVQMGLTGIAVVVVIMYVCSNTEYAVAIYNGTGAFALLELLAPVVLIAGIVFLIYQFNSFCRNSDEKSLTWVLFLTGGLSAAYAATMACGDGAINNRAIVILFPLLATYLVDKTVYINKVKTTLVVISGLLICVIAMSQKVTNAYSWWGWNDEVISDENKCVINVPGLQGFRASENIKFMYEEMYRVVKENTDENSVIYGFPHVRIFNVLCNNSNMSSFVPVPFYDVCDDGYAKNEAILLAENPPDIVIWCDMMYCMEVHEEVFRGGQPLGQRDIQEWFSTAVADGSYELIGQYDLLFIYKRVDGSSPRYTYFKSNVAVNSTIKNVEELSMVGHYFAGDGTADNPYKIETEEDFFEFRDLVNSGCEFTNIFFEQTTNLDFTEYEDTVAIGRWGSGCYFNGDYNGANHSISGIRVIEYTDTGLFGLLGGKVRNLNLSDAYISGSCCGGIASHAMREGAAIINCKVENSVVIEGVRAGGVVDDFSGSIIDCVSAATVKSTSDYQGKLYSYYVGNVINCKEE